MGVDPLRHPPEHLAQLGHAEMLRAELAADQVVKIRQGRLEVTREALPESPGGIVRREPRNARLDKVPQDERLEAKADAVGRAPLLARKARRQELHPEEGDTLLDAPLLERLGLPAGRGDQHRAAEVTGRGLEPGAHNPPPLAFGKA